MNSAAHSLALVAVIALVTAGLRFLPFAVFRKHMPATVAYLGRVLPCAVMGMLVVYCLKDATPFSGSRGIPEALAVLAVAALHKWKHNTLLSILGGTLLYMLLVQRVFV